MEQKLRFRYGYGKNRLKNALVTIRDGGKIYFGIARCNLTEDNMVKAEGKRWAAFRALQQWASEPCVMLVVPGTGTMDSSLCIKADGLQGHVNAEDVGKLLDYFRNIEHIQARKIGAIKTPE
jgi:hypothetical protein